ncbi:MAG: primosomal protein N' [Candidatus Omnitrophica bacterium]|nr:primosomal protein N' [Candidatus Omnitrophota bacterium]MDD5512269.1 primosomal protein N' [Candidatus Omnitrophota bacterium]
MLFAKVVLSLAVEGPFDYCVPDQLKARVSKGKRVWVNFCNKKRLGFVVGVSSTSQIKNIKPVLEVIDTLPVLDHDMLLLTKMVSEYYCCTWGEVIETALPESLRKGRQVRMEKTPRVPLAGRERKMILVHDSDGVKRWDLYLERLKNSLERKESAIILLADLALALRGKEIIEKNLAVRPSVIYRKQKDELGEWEAISRGEQRIILGTRSAVFAPAQELGLIIVDEEADQIYKQEQVPHYHAREVAMMRARIQHADLVLGTRCPSLESYHLAQKGKLDYVSMQRPSPAPQIKIIDLKHLSYQDRKKNIIFSKYLQDAIYSALEAKEKVLIFLNRKGYSTLAVCLSCQAVLKCPRCNINLVYHAKEGILRCHHCTFQEEAPKICPVCNSGYIKFSGTGIEKIENEISRIFPQARVMISENDRQANQEEADILVSTSAITRQAGRSFDLTGVLAIDNALNRVDLRSAEKSFSLLVALSQITAKKMIIQTNFPTHHSFRALEKNDLPSFFTQEIKERKELNFPPYRHLILVKLRGRVQEKVKSVATALFEALQRADTGKQMSFLSVSSGQPEKLRGNFYWQILISTNKLKSANKFLKFELKKSRHSGIIVTVDVDPL